MEGRLDVLSGSALPSVSAYPQSHSQVESEGWAAFSTLTSRFRSMCSDNGSEVPRSGAGLRVEWAGGSTSVNNQSVTLRSSNDERVTEDMFSNSLIQLQRSLAQNAGLSEALKILLEEKRELKNKIEEQEVEHKIFVQLERQREQDKAQEAQRLQKQLLGQLHGIRNKIKEDDVHIEEERKIMEKKILSLETEILNRDTKLSEQMIRIEELYLQKTALETQVDDLVENNAALTSNVHSLKLEIGGAEEAHKNNVILLEEQLASLKAENEDTIKFCEENVILKNNVIYLKELNESISLAHEKDANKLKELLACVKEKEDKCQLQNVEICILKEKNESISAAHEEESKNLEKIIVSIKEKDDKWQIQNDEICRLKKLSEEKIDENSNIQSPHDRKVNILNFRGTVNEEGDSQEISILKRNIELLQVQVKEYQEEISIQNRTICAMRMGKEDREQINKLKPKIQNICDSVADYPESGDPTVMHVNDDNCRTASPLNKNDDSILSAKITSRKTDLQDASNFSPKVKRVSCGKAVRRLRPRKDGRASTSQHE